MSWKAASVLLATYLFYLVIFTLAPYSFDLDQLLSPGDRFQKRFEGLSGIWRITYWDVWTNILLYVPCGYLLASHPRMGIRPRWIHVLLAGFISGVLSLSLEAAQVFLPRRPSIDDVVCNLAGAVVGAVIGTSTQPCTRSLLRNIGGEWRTCTATVGLGVYLLLVFAVSAVPLPLAADLEVWGSEVNLNLGSDGEPPTLWRGTIYAMSVYQRELSAKDVANNFLAGPFPGPRPRTIGDGLVLSYEFSAGDGNFAIDAHGARLPISFRFKDSSRAQWLNPRGLTLDGTRLTMYSAPALRPTGWRFLPHQQFSVELWIVPTDPSDVETVRIVSYSRNPPSERLTLTRYRREFLMSLRPATNRISPASGRFIVGSEFQNVQHVAVTHRDGAESFYLNATETGKRMVRTNKALFDVIVDAVGDLFRWPMWSVLVFPIGVGSYLLHLSRSPSRAANVEWLSYLTVSTVFLLIVVFRVIALKGPLEPLLVLVGAGTMLVSIRLASSLVQDF